MCEDCGYVDVPVEHGRGSGPSESWREAFERFYERSGDSPAGAYPVRPIAVGGGADDERRTAEEPSPAERSREAPERDHDAPEREPSSDREGAAGPAVADGASPELPEATDGGEPADCDAEDDPRDGLDGDGTDPVLSVDD